MPADVEQMIYAGETPWHNLGQQLPSEVTVDDALRLARLDWEVEVARIQTADQERTAVEEWRVTRRKTDEAILGVVRKGFKPIQNRTAFDAFKKVVGDEAVVNTAGSLQGGSKVWALAKLPGVIEVGSSRDPVERYLLLSNNFDGAPLQILFTPVRVVCSNTLALAVGREGQDVVTAMAPRVRVPCKPGAELVLEKGAKTMAAAKRYYERFGEFAGFLERQQVDGNQVKRIVEHVFPANTKGEVTPKIAEYREAVEVLFVEGAGHERIAGTAWALLNGFAQFADHGFASFKGGKPAERSDRAYSIWHGGARNMKQRASRAIVNSVLGA
jgi:phage/plasmid-like protein (TIGR03299 family)